MTKEHEELVEKVGQLLEEYERTCADGHYGQVELDQCRQDLSIDAVAFILSAFHDGRLDEELGVVQRYEDDIYLPDEAKDGRVIGKRTRCVLIALRALTGQAKRRSECVSGATPFP